MAVSIYKDPTPLEYALLTGRCFHRRYDFREVNPFLDTRYNWAYSRDRRLRFCIDCTYCEFVFRDVIGAFEKEYDL